MHAASLRATYAGEAVAGCCHACLAVCVRLRVACRLARSASVMVLSGVLLIVWAFAWRLW